LTNGDSISRRVLKRWSVCPGWTIGGCG